MAKFPLTNKANKYARDIVAGRITACKWVKLACQRHLDDLEKSSKSNYLYKFDKLRCEKILYFAHQMPHVKGKWAGQKITLEPWQCFCLGVPFGWVHKDDETRRFNEIFLLIPRKNGKSTLAAIAGLYMFSSDGERGSEVYCAAGSVAQAFEVFRPAWTMVHQLPEYRKHFEVQQMGTLKNPGNIFSVKSGSRFETVIGKPGDGASPHLWIQDEMHEIKTSDAYDTGKTGMGARSQPMMLVITTAGINTSYPCFSMQNNFKKILTGELVNDNVFAVIYTVDKDDDWQQTKTWQKANPNYGVSISDRYLKSELQTALQDKRKQNILKCKHLNMWSNAGSSWMNMVEWHRCYDETISIEQFHGEPVFIGLDLAAKIDVAAKMYLFKKDDHYYLFSKYYIPEAKTIGEDNTHYAGWEHDGYIETFPGARIDLEEIQNSIMEDAKTFDLSGSENGGGEVCNDPWNAQQLITNLENEKISCVEVSQTVNMLSEPMKEIEAIVKEGKLHHNGNPVTDWMISNVCCRVDKKDNIFPFKEAEENKIDGAVAFMTAMARAMYEKGITTSIYETREVFVL